MKFQNLVVLAVKKLGAKAVTAKNAAYPFRLFGRGTF